MAQSSARFGDSIVEAVPGNGGSSDELLLGMITLRPRTLWRKFGGSADGSRGLYPQYSIPTVATCSQTGLSHVLLLCSRSLCGGRAHWE